MIPILIGRDNDLILWVNATRYTVGQNQNGSLMPLAVLALVLDRLHKVLDRLHKVLDRLHEVTNACMKLRTLA